MFKHEKYIYAKENLLHLQELFGEQSRTVRYEIIMRLFYAKIRNVRMWWIRETRESTFLNGLPYPVGLDPSIKIGRAHV